MRLRIGPIRIGQGWDVHRLIEARPLILGGVTVPSPKGLDGHSDADILAHAITDAILGAIANGDIGLHFPNTDPRWKDVDSMRFLEHACSLATAAGYRIVNVDSTVILEKPKLKDYRDPIRQKLAGTMNLEVSQVSVKFKTAEERGPVGRGETAEAQAVVLLEATPDSN